MSDYSLFDEIENKEIHQYEENLAKAKTAVLEKFSDKVKEKLTKSSLDSILYDMHKEIADVVSEYLVPIPATMRRVKSAFKETPKNKVTAEWHFDKEFNGWVGKESCSDFLCDICGRRLSKLGYQKCKCGKIWNGYSINNYSSKQTSSSNLIVWRAIEDRSDMIVASYPLKDRDLIVTDRDELDNLEDTSDQYVDEISDEPIYDYDTKETQFVNGYMDALNGSFLRKDAHFFYKEGYKAALGIE